MRDGRWQRGALDLVMHLHYILRQLRRRPMTILESESTLTERYQTTIPAAVRKALRLQKHDRIVFKVTPDGKVALERAGGEEDPALGRFLEIGRESCRERVCQYE